MEDLNPQVQLALMLVVVMLLPIVVIFIIRHYRKRLLRREAEAMLRGNKIYSEWRGNKQP
jgi:cell division protein FtsL